MDWLYELIQISVYGLIGFVLGAYWCGVRTRNKQIGQALNDHFKDYDEYMESAFMAGVADRDVDLRRLVKEAFEAGYESGHNDTVEGQYGDACELADEYVKTVIKGVSDVWAER